MATVKLSVDEGGIRDVGLCLTCNGNGGWLSHECSNCRAKREAVEAAQAEAARQAAELERRARLDSMVEAAIADLKTRTDAGATVHLYDCLVIQLDENGWIGPHGLDRLRDLGERGWELLSNDRRVQIATDSSSAVSDIGFDRTQLLLGLAVTPANLRYLDGEIRRYFAVRAVEELDAAPH